MFAQNQIEIDGQSCAQFHQADATLNQTYNQVLSDYAKDSQFIAKLKIAQRAWLAYRDAELEAVYPKTDKQTAYGTAYPTCHCAELQFLTEQRTAQLKRWLDGTHDGDACAGSIKTKPPGQSEGTVDH
jgi:uncharacterized protein YecT (DUF1311 family)